MKNDSIPLRKLRHEPYETTPAHNNFQNPHFHAQREVNDDSVREKVKHYTKNLREIISTNTIETNVKERVTDEPRYPQGERRKPVRFMINAIQGVRNDVEP